MKSEKMEKKKNDIQVKNGKSLTFLWHSIEHVEEYIKHPPL